MPFLILLLISVSIQANVLSFDLVKKNILENFPKIIEQQEKIQVAQSKVQKSEGQFDLYLEHKNKQFVEGYYDGKMNTTSLVKPLQFLNSNIQLGHKRGVGEIPVYNQEYSTDGSGEFFARFELSLLRYRSIDSNRFDLWINRNSLEIEKLKLLLKKQDTLVNANIIYWKWFLYWNKRELYKELVELNKTRLQAVEKRVQKNDLAKIYIDESLQYLYAFEGELASIEGNLREIEAKMKVYFQDFNLELKPQELISFDTKLAINIKNDISEILKNRPELKILEILVQNQNLDISLSEQKIMPKLDLALEHVNARDRKSPYYDESIVSLSVQVPIELNLAKGDISRAKAEMKMVEAQKELANREVKSSIEQLHARVEADINIYNFASLEYSSSKKLQAAEWIRFRNGASDFFLLNTRDLNYSKAKIKAIESFVDFQISKYQLSIWENPYLF